VGAVIIEFACIRLPLARSMVGPDGLVTDAGARDQIVDVLRAITSHVTTPAAS